MHAHRLLGSLVVAATLLTPGLSHAGVAPQVRARVSIRIFDRAHKDYHVWDEREEQAYRRHLAQEHRRYRRYGRLSRRQRTTYWNWRHMRGER